MGRRSLKLRSEMDERRDAMRSLGRDSEERRAFEQENKYAKKSLRGNSRRRSELMSRMRGGNKGHKGGYGGYNGGYRY